MKPRSAILEVFSILFVTVLTTLSGHSEPVVDGVVLDSDSKPVPGVDVSLYVAGRKDPVRGQRTDANGKYSFPDPLDKAFDIVFLHSQYQMASVSRLAEKNDQHISKVIYHKGEPVPSTAADDQLHSVQRVIFLTASLPLQDRAYFLSRFDQMEIWTDPNRLKLTNEVSEQVRAAWQSEVSTIQQRRAELLKSE